MRDQRDTDSRVIYIGPRAFIVIFAAFCGGFIIFLYGVGRFTTSLESEPIAVNLGAPVVASSTPTVALRPIASPAPPIPTTSPVAMAPTGSPQRESTKLPAMSVQAPRSPAPAFAATPASRIAPGEHAMPSGGAGATSDRPRTNAGVKAPSTPAATVSPCPPVTSKAPYQIAHAVPSSLPIPVTSTYLPVVTVPRAATAERAAAVQPATAVTSRPAPVATPRRLARVRPVRKTVVAHAAPATPAALLVPFQNAGNAMSTHALDPRPGLLVSPNAPAESGADGLKPRTR